MAELKTQPTAESVEAFLAGIADADRRADCVAIVEIMRAATGQAAKMWGPSIVGFGHYHYRYASGREGDAPLTGFSPRKQNLTLYIMPGFERYDDLMSRLGKHATGRSCLYLKRLSDIDVAVLRELVDRSVAHMRATYDAS